MFVLLLCASQVQGDDCEMPLPHDNVIYVLEDVDAASDVVHRRSPPDAVAASLASAMMAHHGLAATAADAAGFVPVGPWLPQAAGAGDGHDVGRLKKVSSAENGL